MKLFCLLGEQNGLTASVCLVLHVKSCFSLLLHPQGTPFSWLVYEFAVAKIAVPTCPSLGKSGPSCYMEPG